MREIKFRGLAGNVWRYGDYETHCFRGQVSQICTKNKAHYEVGNTVGQYTGLKDKNGREIYEGDILSYKAIVYTDCSKTDIERIYDEALIGIITHSNIATVVKPYTKNVPAFGHDSENNTKLILDLNSNEIEIVGNIYENKELLEGDHCE